AHVSARYGRIDVLANVAGVISYDAVEELELAEWNRVIAVDQTGVFLGMRAVLPAMLDQRSGSIVNFSSDWGVVGGVGVTAYN
ncbi:SDR family oxidoreductase, partial [Escherichia coli]|uniref:SDR family oxidoreductase n=1 Tax=Escherichia coli TaxID=562 RepID=UPI0021F2C3C2